MLCYAIQYMLCYALSFLGLIRVKIAFQKVNKVFGRNCLLFVFVLCCWTLQGAVDTPLYVSTTYIYSKPYEITFPESTYYIHKYGLWMACPRDLQVACAFTGFHFSDVGAKVVSPWYRHLVIVVGFFVGIASIWLCPIVKSEVLLATPEVCMTSLFVVRPTLQRICVYLYRMGGMNA